MNLFFKQHSSQKVCAICATRETELSAGATSPLVNIRHYKKNIGRFLKVITSNNETFEGKLYDADDEKICLEWKTREPKPVGKGKVTVKKQAEVVYNEIVKAQVVIKF